VSSTPSSLFDGDGRFVIVERGEEWLAVAEGLLSLPTVPLVEDLPAAHVAAFVEDRPGLSADRDAAGNVVVRYQGQGAVAERPLVLVAHLDHPGFAVDDVTGDETALTFRGGLGLASAVAGAPVDFFVPGHVDPVGRGELADAAGEGGRLASALARVVAGDSVVGGFAMWGFPGFSVDDGHIVGRVCDDLLGAAVVLSALDELSRRRPDGVATWGLFTRAEEIGFLGTLEAIRLGTVPPAANVLSLECSKALTDAPQGGGVIVRVGDRASIFDPSLSEALAEAARQRAGDDPGFRWQRKLMDGGTCEATPFCAAGYRASGLALPLGNYHNALDETLAGPGVGPEDVAIDDYLAGVALLVELACSPSLLEAPVGPPPWLAERGERARTMLAGDRRA
jgi:endoglucanase